MKIHQVSNSTELKMKHKMQWGGNNNSQNYITATQQQNKF